MSVTITGSCVLKNPDDIKAAIQHVFGKDAAIRETAGMIRYGRSYQHVTFTKKGEEWTCSWDEDMAREIRQRTGISSSVDKIFAQRATVEGLKTQAEANKWKYKEVQEGEELRLELERSTW